MISFCEENICICSFNNFWRALVISIRFISVLLETKLRRFWLNITAREKKCHPLKNNQMYVSNCPKPASIHVLKVNNGNPRIQCEVCLKVKWRHQSNVNDIVLLLTLNFSVCIVNFEQANASWQNSLILALCVKSCQGNYLIYCLNSLAKIMLQVNIKSLMSLQFSQYCFSN